MRNIINAAIMAAASAGLLLGFTGTAGAAPAQVAAPAACSDFGCDGHDPNIQSWQTGPDSRYSISTDCGYLDLRTGTTDGDFYAWGRLEWVSGCYSGNVWVDRRGVGSGTTETGLGEHAINASGWTSKVGTNTYSTWTGMYLDTTAFQVRACVGYHSPGTTSCTSWF